MRKSLPRSAHFYIWSVVVAALAVFPLWQYAWSGPPWSSGANIPLMVLLLVLTAVAAHFPLQVGPQYNVDLITAVQLAALLLFGPPAALLVIGVGALLGLLALRLRQRITDSRFRRSWRNIAFNVATYTLASGAGGAVYFSLLPHAVPAPAGPRASAAILAEPGPSVRILCPLS